MANARSILLGISLITLAAGGGWLWRQGYLDLVFQSAPNAEEMADNRLPPETKTEGGLTLPADFSISVLTDQVPGARMLALDSFGNLWVSQTSEGVISTVEITDGGTARAVHQVFRDMRHPHGIALDPAHPFALYIAEEDKVSRVGLYSGSPIEKLIDLPPGGRHTTRTVGFGPDGRLYISIGSSCDVCHETDSLRAKIFSAELDGSNFIEYARGLRNSVFFTFHPKTGAMWATEMGRDHLGDNLPPDEINIVGDASDYGWPICYGGGVHDTEFDRNQYIRDPCADKVAAQIELPAHSAPLGLAFIPTEGWPEEYHHDLLVAYHGSWNRSKPTGYKIIRFRLDESGNPEGGGSYQAEDFITGWLGADGEVHARPVDILALPNGLIYISDDKGGKIYKVQYVPD